MNTTFLLKVYITTFFVSLITCVACDKDNHASEDGYRDNVSSKHIVKIVSESEGYIRESNISYDSQGRITRVISTQNSPYVSEIKYQYGEDAVLSEEIEEETYSNGQHFRWSELHTYTLVNGLIVKDVEIQTSNSGYGDISSKITTTYSYDNNGYMKSLTEWGDNIGNRPKNCIWTNGNLTTMGEDSYFYSSIPWNDKMIFYLKGSNMDSYLWLAGYWGKRPKNLPNNGHYSYEYTLLDGLVTRAIITSPEYGDSRKNIITFTWE